MAEDRSTRQSEHKTEVRSARQSGYRTEVRNARWSMYRTEIRSIRQKTCRTEYRTIRQTEHRRDRSIMHLQRLYSSLTVENVQMESWRCFRMDTVSFAARTICRDRMIFMCHRRRSADLI